MRNNEYAIRLVAVQCIETAFEISLTNPQNDVIYGPSVDLLTLVSNTAATVTVAPTHSAAFPSWIHTSEEPVMLNLCAFD
jgi:hypothetical protein